TFDPSVSFNLSLDRNYAPLNTLQVAGVPQVETTAGAFTGSYTQLFPTGTSFTYSLNAIRQNTSQQFLLYNPAVLSRFSLSVHQPLANGFGYLPNKRFMMIAAGNLRTTDELLRAQVTTVVVQLENAYWNLAAAQQAVLAAQTAFDVADRLDRDTKTKVQV